MPTIRLDIPDVEETYSFYNEWVSSLLYVGTGDMPNEVAVSTSENEHILTLTVEEAICLAQALQKTVDGLKSV